MILFDLKFSTGGRCFARTVRRSETPADVPTSWLAINLPRTNCQLSDPKSEKTAIYACSAYLPRPFCANWPYISTSLSKSY